MVSFPVILDPEVQEFIDWAKRKDGALHTRLQKVLAKLSVNPNLGKPLRYDLAGKRRVFLNPHELIFEFKNGEVHVLKIHHHEGAWGRGRG